MTMALAQFRQMTVLAAMLLLLGAFGVRGQDQTPAGQPSGSTSQAATAPTRVDPKAQPVLDRMFQALGGSAFLNFKTLTTHGRLFSLGRGGEGFVYYDSQVEYPDKRRLACGMSKKAKPIIVINSGDLGWEIDRMGMVHLDSADIRQWKFTNRYSLENLLRLRIHEPGALVQTGGVDFTNNVAVNILEIVDSQQTQIKLDVDKRTNLPVEVDYRKWNPTINDWNEYADIYSDYQTFQGIATPMHITRSLNGERFSEVYRSTATYNDTYSEQLFVDPGVVR